MEALLIDATEVTFGIDLNKEEGKFVFEGKSRPENAMNFFDPIINWFEKYRYVPNDETVIEFKLDYFNSSTAKVLLRLLIKFEEMHLDGLDVKIHWYYKINDEDLLEAGEDFSSLVDVPFEFYQMS
jgi:hypothetical protein